MALITTVGGETSDSYVTVAQADAYFNAHYSIAKRDLWLALSSPRKEAALKRACQQLETIKVLDSEFGSGRLPLPLVIFENYDLVIHKLEVYQRLQFPRNVDINSSNASFIPQEVKDSQCEQAVHLLNFDESALLTANSGIVEEAVTAGPVKSYTRYAEGRAPTYLSPVAIELMRPFMRNSAKVRRS